MSVVGEDNENNEGKGIESHRKAEWLRNGLAEKTGRGKCVDLQGNTSAGLDFLEASFRRRTSSSRSIFPRSVQGAEDREIETDGKQKREGRVRRASGKCVRTEELSRCD